MFIPESQTCTLYYSIYIKEGRRKLAAITSKKIINRLKLNHNKGLKSSSNVRDLTEYRLFH
jgi:hypothetical protein